MARSAEGAVLVVTNLDDVTADLVIRCLGERGVPVVRVDPADLGDDLAFSARLATAGAEVWSGTLATPSRTLDLRSIRSVYWRRPSTRRYDSLTRQERDFARAEARHGLFGLLTCLPVPYVSHPMSLTRADFKPAQLAAAADLGFMVPPTLITNDLRQAQEFAAQYAPVVYKTFRGVPIVDGNTGAVWTQRVTAGELDESISVCPHLFQAEVAKGADVRVTVVGDQVFAHAISTPDHLLDWRAGDWDALVYEPVELPALLVKALIAYLDHFALAYGCFDFVLDPHDTWYFIECNPGGQWGFMPDADAIAAAFADLLQAG